MRITLQDGKSLSELLAQATYVHHQDVSSAVWTVHHNLSKFPSVTTVENVYPTNEIKGDVAYPDRNTVTITFNQAITGKAFLN